MLSKDLTLENVLFFSYHIYDLQIQAVFAGGSSYDAASRFIRGDCETVPLGFANVKIDPDVEDDSINRGWLRLT
jgi:hypothetical protein